MEETSEFEARVRIGEGAVWELSLLEAQFGVGSDCFLVTVEIMFGFC